MSAANVPDAKPKLPRQSAPKIALATPTLRISSLLSTPVGAHQKIPLPDRGKLRRRFKSIAAFAGSDRFRLNTIADSSRKEARKAYAKRHIIVTFSDSRAKNVTSKSEEAEKSDRFLMRRSCAKIVRST